MRLVCPGCDREDPNVVRRETEIVRASYPVTLDVVSGRVVDGIDGEAEREVMDTDRDDADFQCEDCGYLTEDADDFLTEDHVEVCTDCDGAGYYTGWPHTTCPVCKGSGEVSA
jgi:hypothetical protein